MATVVSSAQIAAFLSRASRHRALLRRVRSAGVFTLDGGAVSDRSRALAWRRTVPASPQWMSFSTASSGAKKKLPSLAISEAFDGDESDQDERDDDSGDDDDDLSFGFELDDEEDDDENLDDENENPIASDGEDAAVDLSADEQRELAKQLRVAMDRKKQWMQRLAEAGEFDTLLKVVYECYQPLYESHPKLQHVACRLFESYEDPVAAAEAVTKYHPRWYDDRVAKATENEALALFVQKERPALAMAVFHHREWLASELGSVSVPQGDSSVSTDDVEVDFSKHFRSYYSWAAGASAALRDFTQVFTIYENALEQGVFPTANMTFTYLNALIAKREYSAVEALFDQMQKDDRPTNVYFYRQMLFFACVTKKPSMVDVIVNEMKFKGFKLRVTDYLNAIRALDSQFYNRESNRRGRKKDGTSIFFLDEKYGKCLARIADQENAPETYAEQASACEKVLKLFDDMIEEQLEPQRDLFFPRVIAAALFLHDYERVGEYVAQYEKCFGKPLTSARMVTMAVNALLMEDKPVDAWTLVVRAHAHRQKERARRDNSVLECLGNVCAYIVAKQDTALAVQLLEALDSHRMLKNALTPGMAAKLLHLLARDTATVSNEELWDMISERFWLVFPVRSRLRMLDDFVHLCIVNDRWWVISKVLHERSRNDIPHIPARLALYISEKGIEPPTDLERMELVTHLAVMTDIYAMPADLRVPFCCNVVRALDALRNDSSRGLHRKRQIDKIHMEFLRGKKTSLPADVRAILVDNA